jgi:FAD/FMN-containing dehydrogenase
MLRRQLLGTALALAGASVRGAPFAQAAARGRVRPGAPGWPSETDWRELGETVGGRLKRGALPDLADPAVRKLLSDPFYVGDQPGLTQSSGWLGAWRSSPSAYVVEAESASDVAAVVRFARAHDLRLVIKGRGHSYLGGSTAPDSLLVWTRRMDDVTVHDAFTPQGSAGAPVPAVSVGAGAMWLHAYEAVTTGAGRYVQGGGCTTVGVAGLVQGGGFGSFSKAHGTAGASLLEAEIVTADGQARIVNPAQDPDLFWALKGGGGGAFGAITRLTLATHTLPKTFGGVNWKIRATSAEAYRRLLAAFIDHYARTLFNPHWGEQATAGTDDELEINMVFQDLDQHEAEAAWKDLSRFVAAHPSDYDVVEPLLVRTVPARLFWNGALLNQFAPGVVQMDGQPGAARGDFWWPGNTGEVGAYWHAYTSAWLPAALLRRQDQARLVDAWFEASRHWSVSLHVNKGLAGAPDAALAATRDTPMNPEVTEAFALAIIAGAGPSLYIGGPPDQDSARRRAARIQAASAALRIAAPGAGAYVNECDYFQPNWQRAFWGDNYPRLLRVKRRYDPTGLFFVHHGVGSEAWSPDGFDRRAYSWD